MVASGMAGAMTNPGTERDATGGTLVERAADYWSTARYEDVTPEAIRLAKRFLLDTLAAGIAGSGSDVVDVAIKAARARNRSHERQRGAVGPR